MPWFRIVAQDSQARRAELEIEVFVDLSNDDDGLADELVEVGVEDLRIGQRAILPEVHGSFVARAIQLAPLAGDVV